MLQLFRETGNFLSATGRVAYRKKAGLAEDQSAGHIIALSSITIYPWGRFSAMSCTPISRSWPLKALSSNGITRQAEADFATKSKTFSYA
jgi:hypothetical protein